MLGNKQRITTAIIAMMAVMSLAPCAVQAADTINDPFESMNRSIYRFNRLLDKGIVRKVAYGYWAYTPQEFQVGIHNFFENLSQPITVANDLLQGKIGYAFHDTSRFIINSTFGLAGFFEVAAYFGLEPRKEDFGQTLETWGYTRSIYLVLPILGPSTFRDTLGLVVDSLYFDPITYIRPEYVSWDLSCARMFDRRVCLLHAEKLLENVGVDEYAFVRNFYFQKRQLAFTDGKMPENDDQSDPFAEDPNFEAESTAVPSLVTEPKPDTVPSKSTASSEPTTLHGEPVVPSALTAH